MVRQTIIADLDNVVKVPKAAVALNNYLRTEEFSIYYPYEYVDEDGCGNIVPGAWTNDGGGSNTGLSPVGSGIAGKFFLKTQSFR